MDEPYPQLGLVETDGTLHFVDKSSAFTATSIPVGGYYLSGAYGGLGTSPVVASLDGSSAQRILVSDSRNVLLGIDASAASPTEPPVKAWEQPRIASPVVVQGLDGDAAGIFGIHVVDPQVSPLTFTLRRLHADGSTTWEVPLDSPPGTGPRQDLVVAHFTPDGTPDIALQVSATNAAAITTNAILGRRRSHPLERRHDGLPAGERRLHRRLERRRHRRRALPVEPDAGRLGGGRDQPRQRRPG